MKRLVRAATLNRFENGRGSAVGSGIRQGRFKFGGGKEFKLPNGVNFSPGSAQVNIDSNTGEVYVYCNVYLKLNGQDDYVSAEYFALTPEEVSELYDIYSEMSYSQAWNALYDTDPDYFSRCGMTHV